MCWSEVGDLKSFQEILLTAIVKVMLEKQQSRKVTEHVEDVRLL